MLASISATYYTFLEQGRDVRPSRQVLDALATALRLGGAERAHLYELAHCSAPESDPGPEAIPARVAALVDRLDPNPTYVTGRRWDVLAANRAARALFRDWPVVPPEERNMVWWMFTGVDAREVYVEWEQEAAALLARFRTVADRHPDDPEFTELIERLHRASTEVRAWWSRHEVLPLSGGGTKRLRHPARGELLVRHVVLQVARTPRAEGRHLRHGGRRRHAPPRAGRGTGAADRVRLGGLLLRGDLRRASTWRCGSLGGSARLTAPSRCGEAFSTTHSRQSEARQQPVIGLRAA